jgi:hypothetical protein
MDVSVFHQRKRTLFGLFFAALPYLFFVVALAYHGVLLAIHA